MTTHKVAVVTGASSGIGEATARALAAAGYTVYLGARRLDRLRAIAADIGGHALALDVADAASVQSFATALPAHVHVLVNNAGGALGLAPVAEFDEAQWLAMFQSNVLGLARMTRALHGRLLASGDGHVVNIGSIAGFETYSGGAGYTAAKHAVRAISETLRLEWLGQPMRVTEIDPGLVETEFSLVRFAGDAERASKVYAATRPLTAGDIADAVVWATTRPAHVNVDQIVIRPTDQARADKVFRRG
ncbi:MAG: SDR family NAD(P)-dependent oxidoreductase [Thiomonas delicata]|uniref:Putative enzyme n=1 Tax=Thiomonas delicata TaxID=364030 RepID=A0A238D705_THIDL|nr:MULTISPECIES: SDR family NAD(P)-dependent oxidoreductase [Thiomonas]SBP89001.1 putative enzyme [Thiomonas delicata]